MSIDADTTTLPKRREGQMDREIELIERYVPWVIGAWFVAFIFFLVALIVGGTC